MGNVFGFDFDDIESEKKMSGVLPVGEYIVKIEKAEMKPIKSGTGGYVNIVMKVCDMEKRNGATVFDIINVKNESADAQRIGRSRLKKMLEIAGVPSDKMKTACPDNLVGKKYRVFLTIKKEKGYKDKNKVSSYSAVDKDESEGVSDPVGAANKPDWM